MESGFEAIADRDGSLLGLLCVDDVHAWPDIGLDIDDGIIKFGVDKAIRLVIASVG